MPVARVEDTEAALEAAAAAAATADEEQEAAQETMASAVNERKKLEQRAKQLKQVATDAEKLHRSVGAQVAELFATMKAAVKRRKACTSDSQLHARELERLAAEMATATRLKAEADEQAKAHHAEAEQALTLGKQAEEDSERQLAKHQEASTELAATLRKIQEMHRAADSAVRLEQAAESEARKQRQLAKDILKKHLTKGT